MLQYEPKNRLSCLQLINHKFLTENIHTFHKIELKNVHDKIKKNKLEINIKQNKTIWAIFNQEDEIKLMNINPHLTSINSKGKENEDKNMIEKIVFNTQNSENYNIYYNNINNNHYKEQIFEYNNINQNYINSNNAQGIDHYFIDGNFN